MSKYLVVLGFVVMCAGLLWPLISKIPFGQLPGDFFWKGKNISFFFPFTTGLILSGFFSLLLWIISYFK